MAPMANRSQSRGAAASLVYQICFWPAVARLGRVTRCQENHSGLWLCSWQAGKADLIFYLRPNPLTPFPKWEGGIYRRERLSYPFVKIFVGRHTRKNDIF